MDRRTVIKAALLSSLVLTHGAPAFADKLSNIKSSGVVKVAVIQDYPPFGSVGTDMQPVGLDIELAQIVADKLGVKAEIVPSTGPNRIPYLQTGKVDLIIACLGKNEEREKVIDFASPYAMIVNGVYGPPELKIGNLEDLTGKSVALVRGSSEDISFSKVAPAGVDVKRFEDNNGAFSAYQSGQVNLLVTGNVAASLMAESAKRPIESKISITESRAYIGLSKNEPDLLKAMTEIIGDLRKDGTLQKLSEKWLKSELPANL